LADGRRGGLQGGMAVWVTINTGHYPVRARYESRRLCGRAGVQQASLSDLAVS